MTALLALAILAAWPTDVMNAINAERAAASVAPLEYDPLLEVSAQRWCDALKASGWFDHQGYVNSRGYLINPATGKQISRVWLPSSQGVTHYHYRAQWLGITVNTSENGGLFKDTDAAVVVEGWRRSDGHYRNMTNPAWRRMGVARNGWGKGKSSVFAEFSE
jgi:uncharacterized protein YkwD